MHMNAQSSSRMNRGVLFQVSKEVGVVAVARGATGGAGVETGGVAAVVPLLLTLQLMPSHQVSNRFMISCAQRSHNIK